MHRFEGLCKKPEYGTKVVPVTIRDSTYVLDEICNNETELPIREHTGAINKGT
jgi:hypothetical protein